MPAPVFTPEQEAEIRRMIEQQVSVDALSYKVHAPPPTEEEKGDLARCVKWMCAHGFFAAATEMQDDLRPGRDLARAKEAEASVAYWKEEARRYAANAEHSEAKLAKVEASRGVWISLCKRAYERQDLSLTWYDDYDDALAADKEAGL